MTTEADDTIPTAGTDRGTAITMDSMPDDASTDAAVLSKPDDASIDADVRTKPDDVHTDVAGTSGSMESGRSEQQAPKEEPDAVIPTTEAKTDVKKL